MAEPPPFLARWSRLKQQARRRPPAAPPAPRQEGDAAAPAEPALDELPSIDSLDAQSDYRVFMAAKVPDALRNQALRKLWRSDPVFANLDGLVEYGEDYGADFRAASVVKTVYRVLEGMPAPETAEPEPADDRTPAAAPPASAATPPETPANEADATPNPADATMDDGTRIG